LKNGLDLQLWGQEIIHFANPEVAGWGPRAQRQTKGVWHRARNGPIARIFQGGEKAPYPLWGAFSPPD